MHDSKNSYVQTRFICEKIPEAQHSCAALNNSLIQSPGKVNDVDGRTSAEALLITLAPRKKKLLYFNNDDEKKYHKYTWNINEYLSFIYEKKNNTHCEKPLICLPTEKIADILHKSIIFEKEILPQFHDSEDGLPLLLSLFFAAEERKKFCQLDIDEFIHRSKDSLLPVLLENRTMHDVPSFC